MDLQTLKDQLELFLLAHPDTVIRDPKAGLFRLAEVNLSFEIQHGKLYWSLWSEDASIARRVIEVRFEGPDFCVVEAVAGTSISLEIECDGRASKKIAQEKKIARAKFRKQFQNLLRVNFPRLSLSSLTTQKDLGHSLSECYCRGLGTIGGRGWALLGVNPGEDRATVDASLSYALIWHALLQGQGRSAPVCGVKLFVGTRHAGTLATRAAALKQDGACLELWTYDEDIHEIERVDLMDRGNVDTKLSRVDRVPLPFDQVPLEYLPPPIRDRLNRFGLVHRPASRFFSIRHHGLEFARLAEDQTHKVTFGVGPMETKYDKESETGLVRLIEEVLEFRRADSPDPKHPFYRLQSERWLESLVLADIQTISNDFERSFVYPQVPAFSGSDRSVIDVLTLTRQGRLAVIELKVSEDIQLPLQALDYWIRVQWHRRCGDFVEMGYFPGVEVQDAFPLVFLVSPAFRFHSTTEQIMRFFPPQVQVVKVGINEEWRRQIQVLYRRKWERR